MQKNPSTLKVQNRSPGSHVNAVAQRLSPTLPTRSLTQRIPPKVPSKPAIQLCHSAPNSINPKPFPALPSRPVARVQSHKYLYNGEALTLPAFVFKCSTIIPLQILVQKGYHGGDESYSIATGDVYNVHFVKRTKVVVLQDENGLTFTVPLNSAIQFAPIYNPGNRPREALQGSTFERVLDIMAQVALPRVVKATKSHIRVDSKSTIEQNELFVVKKILHTSLRKKALQVYSVTLNEEKLLLSDSVGGFTTDPYAIRLYLPDIINHFLGDFPLDVQVIRTDADLEDNFPHHLMSEVSTLTGTDSETSLIASTDWSPNVKVTDEDDILIEIPIDLPVEVIVCQLDELKESYLYAHTKKLFERFDPCRLHSIKSQVVRKGFEKEGMELQMPESIYDETHSSSHNLKRTPSLLKYQPASGSEVGNGVVPPLPTLKARQLSLPSELEYSCPYDHLHLHTYQSLKEVCPKPSSEYQVTISTNKSQKESGSKKPALPNAASPASNTQMEQLSLRVGMLEKEVSELHSEILKLRKQGIIIVIISFKYFLLLDMY